MPLALILSSHVAGSRVGGSAQALALAAFGIDPVVAPTVVFGRHPGWGPPGGAAVADDVFEGVLSGVEANGLFGLTNLLITGYFASVGQVEAAARAIDRVRAADRRGAARASPLVVVDPIMGDGGRLYVGVEVAEAIARELLPRADLLAPNLFELERLSGRRVDDPAAAVAAARSLGRPVLASSAPAGAGEIGVLYVDADAAWLATHARVEAVPNGTGDLLTALFAAALTLPLEPVEALRRAVSGVAETVEASVAWGAPELPIVALGGRLTAPTTPVRVTPC